MNTRRLPSLNALRTLEAVQETGSISGAARRLLVSHSAVSHQIKILQDWVGSPLIMRKGRSVVLTPAGQSLANVVHQSFDAIRHELDLVPLRLKRSITISAIPSVAEQIILPNLGQFLTGNPQLSIHIGIGISDRGQSPAPEIEIGFKRKDLLQPQDQFFLPGTAVPVAAPALIAKYGDAETALAKAPILSDEDDRMWHNWWEAHDISTAMRRKPIAYFEGSHLMQRAAIEGLGIAFARRALIEKAISEGQLRLLSDKSIDENWVYYYRSAPDADFEPEIQNVIAWLHDLSSANK